MIELFGIIFGGVSRLTQHFLDLRDKDKERSHELAMLVKQVEMQDKRAVHDLELRRMDLESADVNLLGQAIAQRRIEQAQQQLFAGVAA